MFGLAAQSQILKLSHAILAGDIAIALTQLDELARGGKDLGRLLGDLLNHFRNLLVFQISRGDLNLLEVSRSRNHRPEGTVAARRHGTVDTHSRSADGCRIAAARYRF